MHVPEEDTATLKKWVVKRLEDISDADSDVLADYVLALVKSEDEDTEVVESATQNLEDFLKEHTRGFIDDLVATIRDRSYDPISQRTSKTLRPNAPYFIPTAPAFNPPTGPSNRNLNDAQVQSRKRRFDERGASEPRDSNDPHYTRNERQKQIRRGPRTTHASTSGGWQPQQALGAQASHQGGSGGLVPPLPGLIVPSMPQLSIQPADIPPFDPSNPLAALLSLLAPGLPMLTSMPGMPLPAPLHRGNFNLNRGKKVKGKSERCRDYDYKGFCTRGNNCPYEHGNDAFIANARNDAYDPNNSTLVAGLDSNNGDGRRHSERNRRMKSKGRRGDNRASFSMYGDNYDPTNTTIVVEQIPEDYLEEEHIRGFFDQFGEIEEVNVQPSKRLALVRYKEFASAKAAYQSPKTIFENRFVKVYWHKPYSTQSNSGEANGHGGRWGRSETGEVQTDGVEAIDPEEFAQRQLAAQKAHEEKQKLLKETETRRKEVNEQLRAQAEERRKLLESLATKTREKALAANGVNGTNASAADKKAAATDALKAKLAELEAEAEAIGLQAEQTHDEWSSFGRGRGGYRGRGAFAPRGRGYGAAFGYRGGPRGGYRGGRGNSFGPPRGGAVKRLDNRPRGLLISGIEPGSDKDEQLRSFLFNNFETNTYDVSAGDQENTQTVTFTERYIAEMFVNSPPDIENLSLAWLPNVSRQTGSENGTNGPQRKADEAVDFSDAKEGHEYDVAEDDAGAWMGVD